MSENKICEVCLKSDFEERVKTSRAMAVFGPSIEVQEKRTVCKNCGSMIEYEEGVYAKAVSDSVKESIPSMITYLEENQDFTLGEIESSLGLSYRSLSKWKNTKTVSAPALALLRIMRKFPMVIEVAADNFSDDAANKGICKAFADMLTKTANSAHGISDASAFSFAHRDDEVGIAGIGVAFMGRALSSPGSQEISGYTKPQLAGAV